MKISLNIKTRLTLWYILVAALLIILFNALAYFLLSQGLYGRTIHPWDMRIAQIEKTANGTGKITSFLNINQQDWGNKPSGPVKANSYNKDELLKLITAEGTIKIGDILIDKSALDNLDLSKDDRIWLYTYLTENKEQVMVITWAASDVTAILAIFRRVLFIIAPVALVIAGVLGYFYVKRALRPVQTMTQTALEIEEKNLAKRLDISGNDELGQLASTLNRMLIRLEEAFKREKQFTADASHELRTPLAVVQGEATLALKKDRNVEDYKRSLEAISQETERMSSIIKQLLFLARYENNKQLEFKEVNLKELLTELAYDIELLSEDKSLHFQLNAQNDLIVEGDKVSLRELFLNLLNNAIRFTPQGGNVSLTLSRVGNNACVAVKDTGIGIAEEHIKHIFERFYRVDKSRSRSEGGVGLGLSICQRIAELHGGTIEVDSEVGKGSTFSVLLPIPENF
jgi:heavy metal sensor kinase